MGHWRNRHFIGPCAFFPRRSGASFPSLPAGINTDDSDPLGAGVGDVPHRSRLLSGPAGNPVSGGVAIVFPDFSVSSLWKPNSRGKPRKTKDFKECGGCSTPSRFFMPPPPPLSLWQKLSGPQWHEKHPGFYRVKLPPKIGLPGTSNSRQSSRWNQGCLFPYQDTTVSDIFITEQDVFFVLQKLLPGGGPWTP